MEADEYLFQEFKRAYVECMLWSSLDDDGEPMDAYSENFFSEEMVARITEDCAGFFTVAYEMIVPEVTQAGHDFWLTRNHHGEGFWSPGRWPQDGAELTELAHSFGSCDLYVGDDELLYLA